MRLIDADVLKKDLTRFYDNEVTAKQLIDEQPTIEPQPEPEEFEWCTDCKEYDQDKHCCHRWTKVIRETVEELKQAQPEQRWIPCSEDMPEEDCDVRGIQHSETVLITVVNHGATDDTFVDMACTVGGKWQLTYPQDNDPDIPKWCEIIAWMPLPEPYAERRQE